MKTKVISLLLFCLALTAVYSQGFLNLDFEQGYSISNTIPDWTAYVGGVPQSSVGFNTRPLDAAAVTLQGTNSNVLMPIQGNYTVVLFGASQFAPQLSAAIGQVGQIPTNALSLIFWGGSTNVSFNGQALSLVLLGVGSLPDYNIYGADISAFAGQTGQLLFTAEPQTGNIIDNIQFSTSAVPEPSAFALATLGGLLLGFRRWRK